MTTALTKPVRRTVDIGGRPHVVTIGPEGVWMREARCRRAYLLPWSRALFQAQVLAAGAEEVVRPRRRRGGRR